MFPKKIIAAENPPQKNFRSWKFCPKKFLKPKKVTKKIPGAKPFHSKTSRNETIYREKLL